MAHEVANEGDALVLGGVCQTPTYLSDGSKEAVQKEFEKQCKVFVENKVDFLLAEVINHDKITETFAICTTSLDRNISMCVVYLLQMWSFI